MEMASAHAQAFGQLRDAVFLQRPLGDQAQGPTHRGRGAVPGGCSRCGLGPAAKAGPKARGHGFFGGPEKPDVDALSGRRRADRPAIDPGREDADEEPPIEPRVSSEARPVTDSRVQFHAWRAYPPSLFCAWPLSDANVWPLDVNSQYVVPSKVAAPALRHSPRDHAAALVGPKGSLPGRPLAKSVRGRVAQKSARGRCTPTRDFEGPRAERLRAGAHHEASATVRAPAAGPPPAGGDERGAWKRRASTR